MVRTNTMTAPHVQTRVAFPVILFMLSIVLPFSFALGPVVMTGVRLVLIAMVLPMTLRLFAGAYGKIYMTDIFFFLHIMWATLALVINNPDRVVQNVGSTGIEFIGGYLLGRAYIRNTDDMISMLRLLIFIIACTLPIAIFETLTGHPLILEFLRKMPIIRVAATTYDEARLGLDRVQLAFSTPIHYGLFSMLGISFCFVGLNEAYSQKKRLIMTASVILCVFLSLSSGALLPMVLQMFMIFWDVSLKRVKRRWLILLIIFILIYIGIDLLSNRSPYRVFMQYATFSPGTAYWRAAIAEYGMNNVWAHPIFGIGLNDWERPLWMASSSVDNFWLLMAMRYGILGFVTVAIGYGIALWKIGRCELGENTRILNLRKAWVFSFACLALTLYTVHIWSEVYSLVFFLMGSGMWFLSVDPRKKSIQLSTIKPGESKSNSRNNQLTVRQQAVEGSTDATITSRGPTYTRFPLQQSKRANADGSSEIGVSKPKGG